MVNSSVKVVIWTIWSIVFPVGLWYIYHNFPPTLAERNWHVAVFLFFMSIVASMPMIINGRPVFFLQWASLSVFLIFGLFVETMLVQIALVVVLLQTKVSKKGLYLFPLNSMMFLVVSVCSGFIYYGLGGKHAANILLDIQSLSLVILYPFLYFVLNTLLIFMISRFVYQNKEKFMTRDLVWEFIATVITYPAGIALYIMYEDIGLMALILIGIPFICLSIILRLYHSSESINYYLKKIAEIGHQLSQNLYAKEVVDFFTATLFDLLKVDVIFILEVTGNNELKMIARVEENKQMPLRTWRLKENEGICGNVLASKEMVIYHKKTDWQPINKGYTPISADMESVLCMPLVKNSQVIGTLLLGSKKKKAFAHVRLMILDLLCTQFAVAFENAKFFEKTKEHSERCALTKLYNYRFFDQILAEKFIELNKQQINNIGLIMLDIDYFKSVNDTYGHQAGNEILIEFSERLQNIIGENGIVARYDGEEFIVLLTNTDAKDAWNLAEFIRKSIEARSFTIKQNMHEKQKQVHITASLGLAIAPHDADEPLALIRHADRALYVGAKREGRNRVASYIR
ncbi:sensor domain-containing diguanylate cyclase [Niallia sp. 01092]|uniref:sensor domain-containing diguanylate cyclase n=1 Tax=unclassified Niallia TaxID=2837522 RepID=UPI003FD1ABF2